ncbi:hypothetical protein [Zhihengliuella sp.]|uniref:hypothetical protein n=1 Tax=Zhihengliuella sp. TaxID=1954483 RepID=UPI00281142C3|nr:hypothetical protein [Zhihengliuella sp.]
MTTNHTLGPRHATTTRASDHGAPRGLAEPAALASAPASQDPAAAFKDTTDHRTGPDASGPDSPDPDALGPDSPGTEAPRRSRVLRILRAVVQFYRVNWARAAAQESEYLRIKEENLRKVWVATGGRM